MSNITVLSLREHRIAHALLYRIYGRWQDKIACNAMLGKYADVVRAVHYEVGCDLRDRGIGIHAQTIEERRAFGNRLAAWNKANPGGNARIRGEAERAAMARTKAKFVYIAPDGAQFASRREAATAYNVEAFTIENWGRRGYNGWQRVLK